MCVVITEAELLVKPLPDWAGVEALSIYISCTDNKRNVKN